MVPVSILKKRKRYEDSDDEDSQNYTTKKQKKAQAKLEKKATKVEKKQKGKQKSEKSVTFSHKTKKGGTSESRKTEKSVKLSDKTKKGTSEPRKSKKKTSETTETRETKQTSSAQPLPTTASTAKNNHKHGFIYCIFAPKLKPTELASSETSKTPIQLEPAQIQSFFGFKLKPTTYYDKVKRKLLKELELLKSSTSSTSVKAKPYHETLQHREMQIAMIEPYDELPSDKSSAKQVLFNVTRHLILSFGGKWIRKKDSKLIIKDSLNHIKRFIKEDHGYLEFKETQPDWLDDDSKTKIKFDLFCAEVAIGIIIIKAEKTKTNIEIQKQIDQEHEMCVKNHIMCIHVNEFRYSNSKDSLKMLQRYIDDSIGISLLSREPWFPDPP